MQAIAFGHVEIQQRDVERAWLSPVPGLRRRWRLQPGSSPAAGAQGLGDRHAGELAVIDNKNSVRHRTKSNVLSDCRAAGPWAKHYAAGWLCQSVALRPLFEQILQIENNQHRPSPKRLVPATPGIPLQQAVHGLEHDIHALPEPVDLQAAETDRLPRTTTILASGRIVCVPLASPKVRARSITGNCSIPQYKGAGRRRPRKSRRGRPGPFPPRCPAECRKSGRPPPRS